MTIISKIVSWPIKRTLTAFILIILLIQGVSFGTSIYLGSRIEKGVNNLVAEAEELKEVAVFVEELSFIAIHIRDALLLEDRNETQKVINKVNKEIKIAEHEIDNMIEKALYEDDKKIIGSLRKPMALYSDILHKAEELELSGKHKESVKLVLTEGSAIFHKIETIVKNLEESIIAHEHKQQKELKFFLTEQLVVMGIIFALTVIISAILYLVSVSISRKMNSNMQMFDKISTDLDMTVNLDADGESEFQKINYSINYVFANISNALMNARQAAQTLGAATNQLSSTTEECNSNFEQQTHQAQQVQENMNTANQLVGDVETSLGSLKVQIEDIKSKTNFAKEGMTSLEGKSKEIGDFVTLIEDISDQVNLLALNAAIEAARAGDAGRGFAVVADEVRKLAGQTSNSANSIREGISELLGFVTRVSQDLETTEISVNETSTHMDTVSDKSAQQLTTFTEVNSIVANFTTSLQENVLAIAQISEATSDLAREATVLENQIGQFKLRD